MYSNAYLPDYGKAQAGLLDRQHFICAPGFLQCLHYYSRDTWTFRIIEGAL